MLWGIHQENKKKLVSSSEGFFLLQSCLSSCCFLLNPYVASAHLIMVYFFNVACILFFHQWKSKPN